MGTGKLPNVRFTALESSRLPRSRSKPAKHAFMSVRDPVYSFIPCYYGMMRVNHNYFKEKVGAALADMIAVENFHVRKFARCALFSYCLVGLFWRKIDAYLRGLPAFTWSRSFSTAFLYASAYDDKALFGSVP